MKIASINTARCSKTTGKMICDVMQNLIGFGFLHVASE